MSRTRLLRSDIKIGSDDKTIPQGIVGRIARFWQGVLEYLGLYACALMRECLIHIHISLSYIHRQSLLPFTATSHSFVDKVDDTA